MAGQEQQPTSGSRPQNALWDVILKPGHITLQRPKNPSAAIQQVVILDKKVFVKADAWQGGVFEREVQKRNTFMILAYGRKDGSIPTDALDINRHAWPAKSAARKGGAGRASGGKGGQSGSGKRAESHKKQGKAFLLVPLESPAPIPSVALKPVSDTDAICCELSKAAVSDLGAGAADPLVGFVCFTITSLVVHVSKIGVHSDFRRQGIGAILLQVGWAGLINF